MVTQSPPSCLPENGNRERGSVTLLSFPPQHARHCTPRLRTRDSPGLGWVQSSHCTCFCSQRLPATHLGTAPWLPALGSGCTPFPTSTQPPSCSRRQRTQMSSQADGTSSGFQFMTLPPLYSRSVLFCGLQDKKLMRPGREQKVKAVWSLSRSLHSVAAVLQAALL